ncbi:sensor histidine kinase, partial [Mycobacterium tuberculosis]
MLPTGHGQPPSVVGWLLALWAAVSLAAVGAGAAAVAVVAVGAAAGAGAA